MENWAKKEDLCVAKMLEIGLILQRWLAGFGIKTGHFGGRGVGFFFARDGERKQGAFF